MSFPKYQRYKESGVEWLGEVPEHWGISPVKRVAGICYGIGEPPKYQIKGIPLIRATNVHAGKISDEGLVYVDPNDIPENRIIWLRTGDIIVVRSGAYTGDSAIIPEGIGECIAGFDLVLRSKSVHPLFLQFTLLSKYVKEGQLDIQKMRAAQPHLNAEELGACLLALPPLLEQQSIATFLDRETAKIDDLIAEQQRLINLLKEKRQAVISHAVTKGLNPAAPMKETAIEWLGEVPEHWEVLRLGSLCKKIGSGKTPLGGSEVYTDDGILFLRSQNVYNEGFFLDDVAYISDEINKTMSWSRVLPNDVLLNITGASLGRTCLVPDKFVPANVNQHVCIIRLKDQQVSKFIALVMKSSSLRSQIDVTQTGANREGLNFDQISKLLLALPPLDEQEQITTFLDRATTELNGLIAEAQHAIALLQERRTALISAAVTGKIDVRSLVQP